MRKALILFVFVLSGCVSIPASPSPRFYMPASMTSEQAAEKLDIAPGVIVVVGPITIPGSQDRPQIVTRNKDGTLSFAQFDRWAEPLDSSLARLISNDLASLLPAASFQVFPCNFAIPLDYQVVVEVVQLDSDLANGMLFTGQWSIIDAKNRKLLLTKRSLIIEPIDPQDYFGLSKALGAACFSLSREVAGNLCNLAKQRKPAKD